MKKSLKINYIYNVAYQLFALLVPLITTPYISRIFGAEGIGIYSYTLAVSTYFVLVATLGTTKLGVMNIGVNQEDKKKRSQEFFKIFVFRLITTCICLIGYYLYILIFSQNKTLEFVQSLYIIGVFLDISWFYQGMENFKIVSIRNFAIKIISVIFIFFFVKTENDLVLYAIGLATFSLLGNISMFFGIRKYIYFSKVDLCFFKQLKQNFELFIPTFAPQLYEILDKIFIGIFTVNSIENGYYEQSNKIIKMSLVLITTLGTVILPKMSRVISQKDYEKINEIINKSLMFVCLLSILLMTGIVGISQKFVPLFFGKGFEKVEILLKILSLMFIFMGVNNVIGNQYMIASGKSKKYSKYLIVGGVINILLNIILIPNFYSIGAAISSVIGEIIVFILCIRFLKNENNIEFKFIKRNFYKYLIAGIISGLLLKIIIGFTGDSLLIILLSCILISVIYIVILIFTQEELTREYYIKICSVIKERIK